MLKRRTIISGGLSGLALIPFARTAVSAPSSPASRTDEEWLEVRRHAITLIEAPNLLVMKGRRVSAKYEAASGAGELDTDQVQQKIDSNRAAFVALAQRLQDTGLQTLAAIDAKDPVALFELGGTIDEACESCHVTFWYPNLTLPYK